jgi:DNA-binding PadR family transcriptional regulator
VREWSLEVLEAWPRHAPLGSEIAVACDLLRGRGEARGTPITPASINICSGVSYAPPPLATVGLGQEAECAAKHRGSFSLTQRHCALCIARRSAHFANLHYMGARSAAEHAPAPMHSPVNWALLGLVIERPSYAYELARRFERTYEGALSLSSVSHVYTALATLRERGLVHEVAGTEKAARSRRRFEASAQGLCEHADWLISQVAEERRRQRLLVLQLGALARTPERAMAVLDAFERECLSEAAATPPAGQETIAGTSGLAARLLGEEARLRVAAKLRWSQYARAQLRMFTERQRPSPGR